MDVRVLIGMLVVGADVVAVAAAISLDVECSGETSTLTGRGLGSDGTVAMISRAVCRIVSISPSSPSPRLGLRLLLPSDDAPSSPSLMAPSVSAPLPFPLPRAPRLVVAVVVPNKTKSTFSGSPSPNGGPLVGGSLAMLDEAVLRFVESDRVRMLGEDDGDRVRRAKVEPPRPPEPAFRPTRPRNANVVKTRDQSRTRKGGETKGTLESLEKVEDVEGEEERGDVVKGTASGRKTEEGEEDVSREGEDGRFRRYAVPAEGGWDDGKPDVLEDALRWASEDDEA